MSGQLPGPGQSVFASPLFSDGPLEAPGPDVLCPQSAGWPCRDRAFREEQLTVDRIHPWLVDPRGKLAGRVPMFLWGFKSNQEVAGSGLVLG